MNTQISLRLRRPADDGFIHTLAAQVFAPYSFDPVRDMESMLAESGARAELAEVGAARVGFFVLRLERHARDFGPWPRPVLARLNAIAVRPGFQSRGIGRVIMDRVEELARDAGAVALTLTTAQSNFKARRLFEASGFYQLAPLPDSYARRERAIAMIKPL
jgi:ribosomal protein S18 acetylase RimI-like enzyme